MKRGAIAIFVKTPGLSPIKTRLSQTIGRKLAEDFYTYSCKAIAETVRYVSNREREFLSPFWAVAEKEGLEKWQGFSTIYQGTGNLGSRLSHVYDKLMNGYDFVIMVGADSPQISTGLLYHAAHLIAESENFVMGPAKDGGFYFIGGSQRIPENVWTAVSYSDHQTANALKSNLEHFASVTLIDELCDVDTKKDLKTLKSELLNLDRILPAQAFLLEHF